jgi:stage VI sporulation protein D
MTEKQDPGLRFDIYERVHLPDQLDAILEFEEMELIPQMRVSQNEQQVELKGILQVKCVYRCKTKVQLQHLEHAIPVEISLPLNRVKRTDHIQVEIEQFDIDLISSRSLNVTGVLMLKGIVIQDPISPSPHKLFSHEEISGTYSAFLDAAHHSEGAQLSNELALDSTRLKNKNQFKTPKTTKSSETVDESKTENEDEFFKEIDFSDESHSTDDTTPADETHSSDDTHSSDQTHSASGTHVDNEGESGNAEELGEVSPHSDMRSTNIENVSACHEGESDSMQESNAKKQSMPCEKSTANALHSELLPHDVGLQKQKVELHTNHIEWKKLFNSHHEHPEKIKKMRMCIVQKNETLQDISERHQVNMLELQRLNRMTSHELVAGQIVYLP